MRRRSSRIVFVLALLAALLAAPPVVMAAAPAAAGPAAAEPAAPPVTFTVSGAFAYADREWDYAGWTGACVERPVRSADVLVLDEATGKVLGRGVTAADGSFSVACSTKLAVADVVVRADARNRHASKLVGPCTGLAVFDAAGDVYAVFSPGYPAHDTATDLDVGTTVAGAVAAGASTGNPFNVFDCAVAAFDHVNGAVLGAPPRAAGVTLHWPSYTGSWASKRHGWIADDDGDDDAVILHELGHLVHNLYSDSDSPGGMHYFGDSDQDPRLAFAEGYATFFAGAVLDGLQREALYVDCDGAAPTGGVQLRLRLEDAAPYQASVEGASDEVAVACVLHDLHDHEASLDPDPGLDDEAFTSATTVGGLTPARAFWAVFTGPVRKARRLTMNHVWDGWLAVHAADPHYADLVDVFEWRRMRFWNDAFEPDNTPAAATPFTASAGVEWGPERTLYYAPAPATPGGTGDRDVYAVELLAGQVVRLETRYPDGAWDARTQADPYLALHDPAGKLRAADDDSGAGRNARIDGYAVPSSGTWRFEVRSRNATHRYGRYQVRVQILAEP